MIGPAISVEIPVAWGEMDAFGHVNNVQYLRYFETSRIRYFEEMFSVMGFDKDVKPVVAKISCEYKKPVTYPDKLNLKVWIEKLGNASMTMACEMHSPKLGLAARAECVIVMFDFAKNCPARISEELRQKIQALDSGEQEG